MAIIVKGGGGKPEEKKTVTAGTSAIEVLPSSGKTMKKVTVNPTPSQSKTVTPSTSQQTVSPDAGKLLSQVIVNAMASGALSGITVSASGLITAQVGTSGYLESGTEKTKQLTTQAAKTWTPTTADQSISSGRYLTGKQTIKGDSNLIAENIRDGISLFGVLGTMVEGVSGIDMGEVTLTASSSNSIEIATTLNSLPKAFLIYGENVAGARNAMTFVSSQNLNVSSYTCYGIYSYSGNASKIINPLSIYVTYSKGKLTVTSPNTSFAPFGAATYKWIAIE